MKLHPNTLKAAAARQNIADKSVNSAPWSEYDSMRPNDTRKCFRCATCGRYVLANQMGRLNTHYTHLIGRDKRKEEEFRCKDASTYTTTDTARTPYNERTATITPPDEASEVNPAA